MVNKQIRFSTESLSPLFKASIGFDNLVNEFFNEPQFTNATGYPPYNISKNKDDVYEITLAVAGFKKSDIDIELEDGTLKISGTSNVLDSEEIEYLHKGIAERNFVRTFKLAEYVEVSSAKLEDGILRVELERNIPEAMKPKKIDIS
jgi:molecular chaperone IbpA